PGGPDADEPKEEEHQADPEPEADPAAIGPKGGHDRDAPTAAAGEQIHRHDGERKQHRHQCELDRPAADETLAEVDVTPAAGDEPELVDRPDQRLRRAA